MKARTHRTLAIKKVLIANRGEIALRVERACRKLGIESVVTVSDADRGSYFARVATAHAFIGGERSADSYLNIPKLIAAAVTHGCDALHPGYGFLSENAEFARAVRDAGLIWIGPTPETIEALGSKTAARAIAKRARVPTTAGSSGSLDDRAIVAAARTIGYPVIIKAVGGGGGRGMRIASSREELLEQLPRARGEALKNFGNGDIYIERFIDRPRHVEVQLLGDTHGNVLHFGTRDCSTQRRHQKLVEEAPAPNLSKALRSEIERAAVAVAKRANYTNAGTAEFLVSGEKFYFLEMNTRIQVEHPVTEMVTGVDLVELQIRIARGEKLPLRQRDIRTEGHAIEFRLYAEDPARDFAPATGTITAFRRPEAPLLREDFGFDGGDTISPYYDAMLSKIIVTGRDRPEAIAHAARLLPLYRVDGVPVNLDFFRWLLRLSPFRAAPVDIHFVGREFSPRALADLAASEVRDPRHREPANGVEFVEEIECERSDGKRAVAVVRHAEGGVFEIRERDRAPSSAVLSNGLATGLRALKLAIKAR